MHLSSMSQPELWALRFPVHHWHPSSRVCIFATKLLNGVVCMTQEAKVCFFKDFHNLLHKANEK